MDGELARLKYVYEIRSTSNPGHWRDGRFWYNSWTEIEEEEISDSMRQDPRLEIKQYEVEEYPEEVE